MTTDPGETCPWCAAKLKSQARSEFKGKTTFVANCGACGDYVIQSDLYDVLDTLTAAKRAAVAALCKTNAELVEEPLELGLHFVMRQLGN